MHTDDYKILLFCSQQCSLKEFGILLWIQIRAQMNSNFSIRIFFWFSTNILIIEEVVKWQYSLTKITLILVE